MQRQRGTDGRRARALRAITAALLMAVALVAAACGDDDSGSSSATGTSAAASSGPANKVIGISFPNATKEGAVQHEMTFAKAKAEAMGYKLVVNDPGEDLNNQLNTINTWIQQKYPALIAVTLNPDVFGNVVKKATASGTKWITYGSTLPGESGQINMEQIAGGETIGKLAGEWITKELGGEAKVALLTYKQGAWAREREKGIVQGLTAAAPKAKIVARQDALSESEGLDVTRSLLSAHPDLNVVLAIEETATEGAYEAFLAKGHPKDDPKVFLGGIDGTEKALKLLSQGDTMYRGSAALSLKSLGEGMAKTAIDQAEGSTASYHVTYTPLTPGDPEVDEFLGEWGS